MASSSEETLCDETESDQNLPDHVMVLRQNGNLFQMWGGEIKKMEIHREEKTDNNGDPLNSSFNQDVDHLDCTSRDDEDLVDGDVTSFSSTLHDDLIHLAHPCSSDTSLDEITHSLTFSDAMLQNEMLAMENLMMGGSPLVTSKTSFEREATEGDEASDSRAPPPSAGCFLEGPRPAERRQRRRPGRPATARAAATAAPAHRPRGHKRALSSGPSPPPKRPRLQLGGRTPLHLAIELGFPEIVEMLVEAGADVNALDEFGRTPLHLAGEGGHADIVRVLQSAGAVGAEGAPFVPQNF